MYQVQERAPIQKQTIRRRGCGCTNCVKLTKSYCPSILYYVKPLCSGLWRNFACHYAAKYTRTMTFKVNFSRICACLYQTRGRPRPTGVVCSMRYSLGGPAVCVSGVGGWGGGGYANGLLLNWRSFGLLLNIQISALIYVDIPPRLQPIRMGWEMGWGMGCSLGGISTYINADIYIYIYV
jgi:hypothetical protein